MDLRLRARCLHPEVQAFIQLGWRVLALPNFFMFLPFSSRQVRPDGVGCRASSARAPGVPRRRAEAGRPGGCLLVGSPSPHLAEARPGEAPQRHPCRGHSHPSPRPDSWAGHSPPSIPTRVQVDTLDPPETGEVGAAVVLVASRIITAGSSGLCEGLSLLGGEVRGGPFFQLCPARGLSPHRGCVCRSHGDCDAGSVGVTPPCVQWVRRPAGPGRAWEQPQSQDGWREPPVEQSF